jgi:ABC-type transport system substrate-binding protein
MSNHRWIALGLLAVILGSSSWLAAQPPRKEEEEETKDKDKDKARPVVPVPVTEPDKKDAPPAKQDDADSDVGTFPQEAAKATNANAKNLFRGLHPPYDRLTGRFGKSGTTYYIELLQLRELPEGELIVKILDNRTRTTSTEKKFSAGSGFEYTPYELIILEEAEKFLAKDPITLKLDRDEQMDYAARAVAAGLRWHLLAVNDNKRQGKEWALVKKQLVDRYIALQRERFEAFVKQGRAYYDRADEIGLKLMGKFPDNNDVLKDVYRLQLRRTKEAPNPTDKDLQKLRESVLLYERLQGKKDEALIQSARMQLKNRAMTLVSLAQDADKKKKTAEALALLRQAELLDPDIPGVAEARMALRGKVLYVGVPKLPEHMSPATAETDAEHWAVELMFEGLLQTVPDAEAIRYRPVLAESLPAVMPLGRSFILPRNIHWSRDIQGFPTMDARDVRATLNLLAYPKYREGWAADGLDVFEGIDRIDDPFRLRLAYKHGVLEPLERATFKIIPAQYLQSLAQNADKAADDDAFARAPFGTGPFRYEGREREGMDKDGNVRECAVFRANPYYGQRPGKFGLPWIREIRFFVPNQSSIANDVKGGQLQLYPDAPAELVPPLRSEPGVKDTVRVEVAKVNRRIHILAINHRQTVLQSDKLRQGLSAAINRDAILKDVYRAGDPKAHAAMTGPFPLHCWATPASAREAPLYRPGAGGLIFEGLAGRTRTTLRLAYVTDDPKAGQPKNQLACQLIKTQIELASADKNGKPLITIELQALPADKFKEKVHLEFDYDLALTTFDYRDDLYSLSGLLDPEAVSRNVNARNFMGYLSQGTNPTDPDRRLKKLMDDVRRFRDFTKEVKDRTWDIHALFNQRVPFVPLWQLDRYIVTHRDLEIFFDNPETPVPAEAVDPAIVFTGAEMWRLK